MLAAIDVAAFGNPALTARSSSARGRRRSNTASCNCSVFDPESRVAFDAVWPDACCCLAEARTVRSRVAVSSATNASIKAFTLDVNGLPKNNSEPITRRAGTGAESANALLEADRGPLIQHRTIRADEDRPASAHRLHDRHTFVEGHNVQAALELLTGVRREPPEQPQRARRAPPTTTTGRPAPPEALPPPESAGTRATAAVRPSGQSARCAPRSPSAADWPQPAPRPERAAARNPVAPRDAGSRSTRPPRRTDPIRTRLHAPPDHRAVARAPRTSCHSAQRR